MKIRNFAMLFLGMSFLACSNDNDPASEPKTDNLVFEISAKELIPSRAGDPVYSQDVVLKVTSVSVHAFQKSGSEYLYYKTFTFSNWTSGATSMTYDVPEADKLPVGDYQFMAIGRDATDNYTLTDLVVGTTKPTDLTASITTPGDEYEIFAGTVTKTVSSEGARVNITITRKVAGVLGYFKNVPKELNGETVHYLQLAATHNNQSVNLSTGVGTVAGAGYNIFKMDISAQSVNADGVYTGNDLSAAGVVKLDNSQLNGAYMMPAGGVSLVLSLLDASSNVIKSWNVANSSSATVFDINANHFYSLGKKIKYDTTTGENPGDPGDDDNAIDLLVDQEIVVTIDPAWSVINYLNIQ